MLHGRGRRPGRAGPASTSSTCRPSARRRCAPRSGTTTHATSVCSAPVGALRPSLLGRAPALPASCAGHAAAAGRGLRLAQCRMAHPPATSATPISASRWRSIPVKRAPLRAVWRLVVARRCRGSSTPVRPGRRWSRRCGHAGRGTACTAVPAVPPERVAPAAGFAVRISGTTHAAAPAAATADIRPMAWRRRHAGAGASPARRRCGLPSSVSCHVHRLILLAFRGSIPSSPAVPSAFSATTPLRLGHHPDYLCLWSLLCVDNARIRRFLPPGENCAMAVKPP